MEPRSRRNGPPEAEVLVSEPGWRRAAPGAERIVRRAASVAGGADTVVLANDRDVKRLNALHRGRNKPTNVLTFPMERAAPTSHAHGGEIVLALGTVRREARAARRSVARHLAHLVVHGALHLRGYDHEEAGDARRMEQAEARLLARIGVPNPWKPRAS